MSWSRETQSRAVEADQRVSRAHTGVFVVFLVAHRRPLLVPQLFREPALFALRPQIFLIQIAITSRSRASALAGPSARPCCSRRCSSGSARDRPGAGRVRGGVCAGPDACGCFLRCGEVGPGRAASARRLASRASASSSRRGEAPSRHAFGYARRHRRAICGGPISAGPVGEAAGRGRPDCAKLRRSGAPTRNRQLRATSPRGAPAENSSRGGADCGVRLDRRRGRGPRAGGR